MGLTGNGAEVAGAHKPSVVVPRVATRLLDARKNRMGVECVTEIPHPGESSRLARDILLLERTKAEGKRMEVTENSVQPGVLNENELDAVSGGASILMALLSCTGPQW